MFEFMRGSSKPLFPGFHRDCWEVPCSGVVLSRIATSPTNVRVCVVIESPNFICVLVIVFQMRFVAVVFVAWSGSFVLY